MDGYWNIDGDPMPSGPLTGFTNFPILNERPPNGHAWFRRRLTNVQATSRPDCLWPEGWFKMFKCSQQRERRHWAFEKPKLDNARKLRGVYYIDPDDMEFTDTMKNARKVLKMPLESAMPRKFGTEHGNTCSIKHDSRRTRYACITDAHESTRTRTRKTQSRDHEDLKAEKEFNSFFHHNLG